jgi:hypothetical protein
LRRKAPQLAFLGFDETLHYLDFLGFQIKAQME